MVDFGFDEVMMIHREQKCIKLYLKRNNNFDPKMIVDVDIFEEEKDVSKIPDCKIMIVEKETNV